MGSRARRRRRPKNPHTHTHMHLLLVLIGQSNSTDRGHDFSARIQLRSHCLKLERWVIFNVVWKRHQCHLISLTQFVGTRAAALAIRATSRPGGSMGMPTVAGECDRPSMASPWGETHPRPKALANYPRAAALPASLLSRGALMLPLTPNRAISYW